MRTVALLLLAVIPLACSSANDRGPIDPSPLPPTEETAPSGPPFEGLQNRPELGATCDPKRGVTPSGLPLIVKDPEVLARFELKRVLAQLIATSKKTGTPETALQRIFDTENTTSGGVFSDAMHCDAPLNRAFINGPSVQCPRAEGALAKSKGLFTPGDPDYFAPVALIHRFDLVSTTMSTCGEYRILYAKTSGKTDPKNRVFLIFEAALGNPKHSLAACRPIADRLALWDKDTDRSRVANDIDQAYFAGGDGLPPIVHANSFGFQSANCTYAGECGQLRIGQGMEAPWEFRELRLHDDGNPASTFQFEPTTVKGSPVPARFSGTTAQGDSLRTALKFDLFNLMHPSIPRITTSLGDLHNGGESAMSGAAAPDYVARIQANANGATFMGELETQLAQIPNLPSCPAGDPLTATSLLRRFAGLSCAGCHAPEKFVAADRKIGCGMVWPKTLGETHIDENGNISDALRDVFLPHRAKVLTTYLQACDADAVQKNLVPSFGGHQCFAGGTMITMADGSKKPIEQIEVGDRVLSFDENKKELVSGEVTKTFVHPKTDHLVVVNGSLVTTANHPFWSQGKWVAAEELAVGSPLFDGASVNAIEMRDGTATTYNFTVAEHHDYFAGGYLVHNKK